MASNCTRDVLDQLSGRFSHAESNQALEWAVQVSGGVSIPGGTSEMCGHSAKGHGLVVGLW